MIRRTSKHITEVHYYDVSGYDPIALRFSRNGTAFIPDRVRVEFLDGVCHGVKISGGQAKKDGSASDKVRHEQSYSGRGSYSGLETMPQWAWPLTQFFGVDPEPLLQLADWLADPDSYELGMSTDAIRARVFHAKQTAEKDGTYPPVLAQITTERERELRTQQADKLLADANAGLDDNWHEE